MIGLGSWLKRKYDSVDAGFEPVSKKPVPKPFFFLYWAVSLALMAWLVWLCATSPDRWHHLANSFSYLFRGIPFYFEYINSMDPTPVPTSFDETDFAMVSSSIGTTWQSILRLFATFGRMLITKRSLVIYGVEASDRMMIFARFLSMIVFAGVPFILIFKDYNKSDTQLNRDSRNYKSFKAAETVRKLQGRQYRTVKTEKGWSVIVKRETTDKTLALDVWDHTFGFVLRWSAAILRGYLDFMFGKWVQPDDTKNARKVNKRPFLKRILRLLLLYYFNVISGFVGFVAYYFVFFSSFDPVVLGKGVAMGLIHLFPAFSASPIVWAAIVFWAIDKLDKALAKAAYGILEKRNEKALVKAMTESHDGPPGSGKTTGMTAEGEIKERLKRESYRKKMASTFAWFPFFPWTQFLEMEMSLMNRPSSDPDRIGNTANAEQWASETYDDIEKLWPRIRDKASMRVWNGKETVSLRKAMAETAKAYLLFRTDGLMWASNYPVKAPCWCSGPECVLPFYDYKAFGVRFDREPERLTFTYKADMNAWKVDRPVDDGKGNAGQGDFEGIVWTISEINKEYVNAKDGTCSYRLGDGVARALSYSRHYMTFWSKACVDFICDTQRIGDLPVSITSRIEGEAIVRIQGDKPKNLLPLWNYRRWLDEAWIRFSDWFAIHCARNDQTLLKRFVAAVDRVIRTVYESKLNAYNYEIQSVYHSYHVGEGLSTNETKVFYIFWCDVFADRMATDAAKPQVNERRLETRHSFRDLGKWASAYPTKEEKLSMNGYEGRDVAAMTSTVTVKRKDGINL